MITEETLYIIEKANDELIDFPMSTITEEDLAAMSA